MAPPPFCPVIGILSHPGKGGTPIKNKDASYIAASYVKFVSSAGARVIPLIFNESRAVLDKKLGMINGVIFTGGNRKSGPYFEVVKYIFNYVLKQNRAGNHFPVLAICLGFELLAMIVSEDKKILQEFSALNQASKLQFMSHETKGTMFEWFPDELIKKLKNECLAMQNHSYGISRVTFNKNKKLCDFFKILTTSKDARNRVYVSTVQAHKYPVIGVQWHPEKNAFEWGLSKIPHSEAAIQASQHVAYYFIRLACKSQKKRIAREVLLASLIYKCKTTYTGQKGSGFDEVYVFPNDEI